MIGCDVDATGRGTEPAALPGSTRDLRLLAAGAILPVQLSEAALATVLVALRTLLRRCEAEVMRRQGYPVKRGASTE